MAQHELDPEAMGRLIDSSDWQHYLREFLLPTFALAVTQYDGASQDHSRWQWWKLALKLVIETPYRKSGRQSPLDVRWAVESYPVPVQATAAEEKPVESSPARPIRRTTFPAG